MARLLNALLRLSLSYFVAEVLLHRDDHRFAGKAIPIRNFIIVSVLSFLFPWLHLTGRRPKPYSWGLDNLYLSIFWLDMAGNSFDLYDTHYYFDLIPHFHGTGATAAVLKRTFALPSLSALGLANALHLLLEVQEYYTDVLFGTHNVRGVSDTVNDLLAGLLGAAVYTGVQSLRDLPAQPVKQ
ncbi:MAG: hypothetical protein HY534_06635 [Chloroflexi bacterium]|nr:hypothetical protein [Chloroflexota bacterium]